MEAPDSRRSFLSFHNGRGVEKGRPRHAAGPNGPPSGWEHAVGRGGASGRDRRSRCPTPTVSRSRRWLRQTLA